MMNKFDFADIDIDRTLERATVTKEILEVVYSLLEVEGYTKENAATDLLRFLDDNGFLDEITQYKGK